MARSSWVDGGYVREKARIVMSVAMAGGGHLFSTWLRDRLMKTFKYYSSRSVYLDTVEARQKNTEHNFKLIEGEEEEGKKYVSPDWRYRTNLQTTANGGPLPSALAAGFVGDDTWANTGNLDVGYIPIGASNQHGWEKDFNDAMQEARVLLIIQTPEFFQSSWCMKEWNEMGNEVRRRSGTTRKPLYALALRELGCPNPAKPINVDKVAVVPFSRVPKTFNNLVGWGLSDTTYDLLVSMLEPHLQSKNA